MEVKTETKVVSITLTMTQEEAEWLTDVMQNPFCEDCGRESEETKHMREKFFSTLATVWPQQKEPPAPIKQAPYRCPDCGSRDLEKLTTVTVWRDTNSFEHWLECRSCSAKGPKFITDSSTPPPAMSKLWEAV